MAERADERAQAAAGQPAEEWPQLRPGERLSEYLDYAQVVPNYEELVAAEGQAALDESLDYLFYFLNTSYVLLGEPEFADLDWTLHPHDYLAYDLVAYAGEVGGPDLPELGPALTAPRVQHMIADGLRRYYTPAVRCDIERRARALARRCAETVKGVQAEALALATGPWCVTPLAIGLLVESFRVALFRAALALPDFIEREWQQRDRRLDPWLVALRQGSYEQPADEALQRLQQAGQAALPLAASLCYDGGLACDDYAFRAALRVTAAVPSPQSLWLLGQAIVDCPVLGHWAAEQLVANMPGPACDYFRYLLTRPDPPAWAAVAGLWALAAAHCSGAAELAQQNLYYRVDDATLTEAVQVAAWEALLALDDPAALPALRAYLADGRANPAAREQLIAGLRQAPEPGWRREILRGREPP